MKYVFFFVFACLLLVGAFVGSGFFDISPEPEVKQELTQSQVEKMIEIGIIKVNSQLQESKNDKDIGLAYQTQYGDCNLYRDIFGRYYCRW